MGKRSLPYGVPVHEQGSEDLIEMEMLFFPFCFLSCAVMAERPNTDRKNFPTCRLGLQLGTKVSWH